MTCPPHFPQRGLIATHRVLLLLYSALTLHTRTEQSYRRHRSRRTSSPRTDKGAGPQRQQNCQSGCPTDKQTRAHAICQITAEHFPNLFSVERSLYSHTGRRFSHIRHVHQRVCTQLISTAGMTTTLRSKPSTHAGGCGM